MVCVGSRKYTTLPYKFASKLNADATNSVDAVTALMTTGNGPSRALILNVHVQSTSRKYMKK